MHHPGKEAPLPTHALVQPPAVIFDLDGVIVDSQKLHAQVEHELLRRRSIDIPASVLTHRFSGVSMHAMLTTIFHEEGYSGSVEEAVAEKRAGINALPDSAFEPIPGVVELITGLAAHGGTQLAVASASGIAFIRRMLRIAGVEDRFAAVASSQEVQRGKPAPDVFLLAAERVRIDPIHCIVIEDGIPGMLAARAAGMRCIAFVTSDRFLSGLEYPARFLCGSMEEISRLFFPDRP